MVNIYMLFICIVAPLILMLFIIEKNSRLTVGYMIIGILACLFASEVNGLIRNSSGESMLYLTTTVTPIVEEIIKAIPVIFFCFNISDNRVKLLTVSMAVGIGFAILENVYIFANVTSQATFIWALTRGFGAGLMHGICTAAIGFGASFVHKKKKLFYTGIFGLLTSAIIYHATYNCLVQSDYKYVGVILPVATYIPIIVYFIKKKVSVEGKMA